MTFLVRTCAGLALAVLAAGAAPAEDALKPGTALGTTQDAIRAALVAQGYEVRKFDTEDGMTEVYAVKGGTKLEIYVDPRTGLVSKVKQDD